MATMSQTTTRPRIKLRPPLSVMAAGITSVYIPPDEALVEGELLSRDLHAYLRQAWSVLEPQTPFKDNWHIGAVCEHLAAQSAGQIQKLLINIPFKTAKSITACVAWPSWEWTRSPAIQWLFTAYAGALSQRDSVKCRTLIESVWYRQRWGHVYQLTTDQNTKHRYENSKRGVRLATSFDGLGTGEGGNRIVIDDAHNMKEIMSDTIRNETIRIWKESLSSRRNDPRADTFTAIMQRGHEKDFSGHVLAEEGDWEHLCLPMEYEPKRFVFIKQLDGSRVVQEQEVKRLQTSIGFIDPRTKPKELLHPARFSAEVVAKLKTSLGTYGASGQLQQRPTPNEGGLFPRDRWMRYRPHDLPGAWDEVVQSWDMSFKKTDDSSRVAGQVWGRGGAKRYLLARVSKRMDLPETLTAVIVMSASWPLAVRKLIEDKANGPAVIQMLRSKVVGLIPFNPTQSKEARAQVASVYQEAGNLYLPATEDAPWVEEYIELMARVPRTDEWDDCDATSQAQEYFGPGMVVDVAGGSAVSDSVTGGESGLVSGSADAPWNM